MGIPLKARDIFESQSVEESIAETPTVPLRGKRPPKISEPRPVARASTGPWVLPTRSSRPLPRSSGYARVPGLGEYLLTMSKASLFGLIFGLMLLGILFFMAGFLVALSTIEPQRPVATQPTWAEMSAPHGQASHDSPFKGVPILGTMARAQTAHLASHAGVLTKGIVGKVPAPLQPFANHLQSQQIQATQRVIHQTAEGRPPGFAPAAPSSSRPPPAAFTPPPTGPAVQPPLQPSPAPQPSMASLPSQPYPAASQPMVAPQPYYGSPQPMTAPPLGPPMPGYPSPRY